MRPPTRTAAVLIAGLVLAGCLPPPETATVSTSRTAPSAPVPTTRAPGQEPVMRSAERMPRLPEISGRWCFYDSNGRLNQNIIRRVPEGIFAAPRGRSGRSLVYTAIDELTFQRDGMTYMFLSPTEAVWRTNTREIFLERCG
jgi:hypothetical protein